MREAIVTDGLWRKSLSAVRSLGKAGYAVTVTGDSLLSPGFWSRFCRKRLLGPTAETDPAGFGAALLQHLEKRRNEGMESPILLPMEDASLRWVSNQRQNLEGLARFLIPSPEALEVAWDKAQTLRLAQSLGIPCPRTDVPRSAEDLQDRLEKVSEAAWLVKPVTGSGSRGLVYGDRNETPNWVRHWEDFGPLLIQERLPSSGEGLGVGLIFDSQSRCAASFTHQRLQQYPNSGGPSTDRAGIHAPELVEQSIRLLQALSWKGVAMVEWKRDARDGTAKLMEINPRFWGSLELAVRSGVDFPLLYARLTVGESAPSNSNEKAYLPGIRCRWMVPGELLRYFTQQPVAREPLRAFMKGLPEQAEEWDPNDKAGSWAAILCPFLLALNPRYWKFLKRA